ncbi:MAG: hypothetical protein IKN43_08210 [Selenomonadaceae bacterium]|nr:hypothetical protein [Selenomonadaceae bacterium]
MTINKEYETEIATAKAEYENAKAGEEAAIGRSWKEVEKELFTDEEIRASEFKALLLEACLKAQKNMGLDKRQVVELSLEFFDEMEQAFTENKELITA